MMSLIAIKLLVAGVTTPTAEELETHALQQRRAIMQGSAKVTVSEFTAAGKQPDFRLEANIWFDRDRLRIDRIQHGTETTSGYRMIDCRHCEKNGYYLNWEELQLPGERLAVSLKPIRAEDPLTQTPLWDLRILGMVPVSFMTSHHFTLDSAIGYVNKKATTLTSELYHDELCWRLSYDRPDGSRVSIWFQPSKGNGVARITAEGKDREGKPWRNVVESDLRLSGGQAIWFPHRCEFTYESNGSMIQKEIVELTDVVLNKPIPSEIFTIAGMNIRDGTPIHSPLYPPDKDGSWYVENGVPVKKPHSWLVPGQIVVTEKRKPRWAIYVGITAGVAGVVLVGYYLLRRRSDAAKG